MSGKYNRKDFHYQQAKASGVRSRAYYKLAEIDQKHKLIKPGLKILDLGAWPGSWMQYVATKIGEKGLLVGIDLVEIEPFNVENIKTLQGDLYDEQVRTNLKGVNHGQLYDLVISDMSPKLTGIKEADQAQTVALAELAVYCASELLTAGGNIVIKVFKGGETDNFIKEYRQFFNKLIRAGLDSTRKTSNEFYIIGLGFKPDLYSNWYDSNHLY